MDSCTFIPCGRPLKNHTLGLCAGHTYQHRQGQELKKIRVFVPWTLERILETAAPDGDCLRWMASDWYVNVKYDGKTWKLHRLVYHLATGDDIRGQAIHHTCAHKWCINPSHLQLATTAENSLEMLARTSYEARIRLLEAEVSALRARVQALETNGGMSDG